MAARTIKIGCLMLAVLSICFWTYRTLAVSKVVSPVVVAEETGDSGDSGETDFG